MVLFQVPCLIADGHSALGNLYIRTTGVAVKLAGTVWLGGFVVGLNFRACMRFKPFSGLSQFITLSAMLGAGLLLIDPTSLPKSLARRL